MTTWGDSSIGGRIGWLLAAALVLLVGFTYLSSGLVVPGPWLFVLWAVWPLLVWWLVRLRYRSIALVVPVAGAAFWFAFLTIGAPIFDWTP